MTAIRKFISALALTGLLFVQVLPVSAQVPPPPPTPPSAPEAPTPPPPPPPPPSWNDPTPTPVPAEPSSGPDTAPSPTPVLASGDSQSASPTPPAPTPTSAPEGTGSQSQNGQSGDAVIDTGSATNSGTVVTVGNENVAGESSGSDGVSVLNADNGSASTNDASVTVSQDTTTVQDNTANVQNQLDLDSATGNNSASYNTGGDSLIRTGDANVSGTAITAVNTNVDGVMVSEFNIVDDHVGDYVLDFAANCIAGCTPGSLTAGNTGNGAGSDNNIDLDADIADNTFQTNDATVGNSMVLSSDSGHNDTDANTNGDNLIATGDANVSASALTFANNNFAGNVVYGVVNIYGDLIGNIVFPEEQLGSCCGTGPVAVSNSGNGADSTNTADVDLSSTDNTFQTNDANIENVLVLDAQTGLNDADANTGGTSGIVTGDSSVVAQVLNIANSNLSGGNWWLVLVNEAGKWIGHIVGGDGSANFAGSPGTEFVVAPDGSITAANTGNGADSQNTTDVSVNQDTTTVQTNTANVQNTLDLSANTGANSASYNTGGSSIIQTGEANIVANIVNFVNNNISGGGRLFVTVVNVFGSWMGNFVSPGAHDDQVAAASGPVGGAEVALGPVAPQPTSIPGPTNIPQPTLPAPRVSSQVLAGVSLSSGNSGPGESSWSGLDGESEAQVAGFLTDAADASDTLSSRSRPVIHINLAWLLLVLPSLGILWAIRRRLAHAP